VKDLDVNVFIRQATEYEGGTDSFATYAPLLERWAAPIRSRSGGVKELIAWVASATSTASGQGPTCAGARSPHPRRSSTRPSSLRQRFSGMVERAGGGVQQAFDKFASWLDRDRAATARTKQTSSDLTLVAGSCCY